MPIGRATRIARQVAKGLQAAHEAGVVHRDLKPENVMLVKDGDGVDVAKVLDFGIAKHDQYSLRDKTTKTGSFMGTPYYMSPEQARGRNIDWRSDLWALGVIVFQCLTGKPPFESEALGELMGMILYDPIPKLTERNPQLPSELEPFWERAVNRDRELRFQSAKEFANALAEAAMLERLEVPTLPPRASIPAAADADRASLPPPGRGSYASIAPRSELSDASEQDSETGAPVSRTRRSVLPSLHELTPRQKRLAIASGVAAIALIGVGVSLALSGGKSLNAHAATDTAEAPVAEPAAPPTPVVAPRLAEVPPAPTPSVSAPSAPVERELDEEQKKKDKKKRTGFAAPAGPAASPDYGI
jgi:serine/threonine-protein kinase